MLKIVTFLWRDPEYRFAGRYGPDHVNRLRAGVERGLKRPHEFISVTDDPTGIDDRVKVVPLWNDARHLGGTWVRVKLFAPEMRDILGERFVLMDLDCVVTGDLTPLFDTDADFVTTRSKHRKTEYNTGFFILTAGSRAEVWDRFDPATSPARCDEAGAIGWEQAWVSLVLGPGERTWGPEDGVLNYRYDVLEGGRDPEDARVVFFPGNYDPSLLDDSWVERCCRL